MRHTRSAFPASVAGPIQPHDETAARVVREFCRRLRQLPLGAWVQAAARAAEMDEVLRPARARLRACVDRMPRSGVHVIPRVQDLASVTEGLVNPITSARMRKVALTAALALFARPQLSADDFRLLYEPFADAIPLADLERGFTPPMRLVVSPPAPPAQIGA